MEKKIEENQKKLELPKSFSDEVSELITKSAINNSQMAQGLHMMAKHYSEAIAVSEALQMTLDDERKGKLLLEQENKQRCLKMAGEIDELKQKSKKDKECIEKLSEAKNNLKGINTELSLECDRLVVKNQDLNSRLINLRNGKPEEYSPE